MTPNTPSPATTPTDPLALSFGTDQSKARPRRVKRSSKRRAAASALIAAALSGVTPIALAQDKWPVTILFDRDRPLFVKRGAPFCRVGAKYDDIPFSHQLIAEPQDCRTYPNPVEVKLIAHAGSLAYPNYQVMPVQAGNDGMKGAWIEKFDLTNSPDE